MTKKEIGRGHKKGGLYFLDVSTFVAAVITTSSTTWHARFGHPSSSALKCLAPVLGFNKDSCDHCEVCHLSKQTRLPFPLHTPTSSSLFELIHVDVWGKYATPTKNGHHYFLTIVDDFSRVTWTYLMKYKSDAYSLLVHFLAYVRNQFQTCVKTIRSDNGTEFTNNSFQKILCDSGILQQFSCPGTPQQNGVVERKHRHLLNVARALRFQADLPLIFWGDCILTATYLINRTPSKLLAGQTPYEKLYGHPPDFTHLRTFGCLCYASTSHDHPNKFAPRARRCIFVGYPAGQKAFKLYDIDHHTFLVSRDVIFHETIFPFKNSKALHDLHMERHPLPLPICDQEPINSPTPTPPRNTSPLPPTAEPNDNEPTHTVEPLNPSLQVTNLEPTHAVDTPTVTTLEPRHSERLKKPPAHLADYVCNMASAQSSSSSPGMQYPISNSLCSNPYSNNHLHFINSIIKHIEPTSYTVARKDPHWRQAMEDELKALEANNTWTLEFLPPDKTAIGCKWVYRIKYKSDGSIDRYKARLVAKGYSQLEGFDFTDVFAPVTKLTTVRTVLSIAAAKNWPTHQMDVSNAFLHGNLHEEVYMQLPPGFRKQGESRVCRLNKSLYGLKQAPRTWFTTFSSALLEAGFT